MQDFRTLEVWKRGHALVLRIYEMTAKFPRDERFGVTSQIRRAAVSVATNIAEGSKRRSNADYARFLNLAEGSAAETECLLLLCQDLNLAAPAILAPLLREIDEVSRMLSALRLRVESRHRQPSRLPTHNSRLPTPDP